MSSIKKGQKGASVLLLQGILHKLGYDITDVDGIFGGETFDAVKSFQSDMGLDDDGVVGKNSANAIVSELWALGDGEEDAGDWEDSDSDWDDDEDSDDDWGDDESSDDDDDWGDDDDYDSV